MAVETDFTSSLFDKLKVEDPWLPPATWESFPVPQTTTRRGLPITSPPSPPLLTPSVSEASLVRLALNSLQGVESAILSIEKLSSSFCSVSADRSFHGNPSLWNRSSSTHSLGRILKCIGCFGSLVFLLRKFVESFKDVKLVGDDVTYGYSLVNQAFAVAVEKVLEGYICGLDTLCASVGLRRGLSSSATSVDNEAPSYVCETEPACFGSVASYEVTLLEVYLHTKELRTQIQSLGNVCKLCDIANCFAVTCTFEKMVSKAKFEFSKFYRGGDLLSYLYRQLQVADCAHLALLKFLFLRSCEPYSGFIRSWMFKAEISDPFKEFVVECADNKPFLPHCKVGNSVDFSLASVKDDVAVPCFLKDIFIPIVRAGQQLQVLKKLLELCNLIGPADYIFEDLLPRWSEYSSDHSLSASPISFSKGYLQNLVIARNTYYIKMQERLENLLIKLEFRYPEAVLHSNFTMSLDDRRKNSKSTDLVMLGDRFFANSTSGIWDSNFDVANTKSDCSESENDVFDTFESSECSSLNDSEEQTKTEQLIVQPDRSAEHDQSYILSLRFSMTGFSDVALKNPAERESPHTVKSNLHGSCDKNDAFDHFHFHDKKATANIYMPIGAQELSCSSTSDTRDMDLKSKCRQLAIANSPFSYDIGYSIFQESDQSNSPREMRKTTSSLVNQHLRYLSNMPSTIIERTLGVNQLENETYIPTLFSLQPWKDCNPLSANPTLRRNRFFHPKRPGEKCSWSYAKSIRCFDFSTVEDPFKVSENLLAANLSHQTGSQVGPYTASPDTGCKSYNKDNQEGNDASVHNAEESCTHSPLDLKENGQKGDVSTNFCGGNGWGSLLGSFCYAEHKSIGDHRMNLSSMVEIPLDFVIDKCLVQEILLQYKYVSRLAIKVLEEGFDLQEHLLALRRYYFMESSDWADLFIMSLWHHLKPQKWSVAEADQRVPEIQGLLELAVQRSSCEWDPNKDRLFVFIKGNHNDNMPLSTYAVGIHSFDFLGLGYRVDWPVNIVLTPRAMKIYVEIFSFLIQVKLAVFSLTDIWRSLKDLMPLVSKYRHSKMHEREVGHFNMLMRMRHQVSHFVSTLQQYVQSQLSLVSWCKFLHSLKNKVKDMMDLEPVHMAYLEDSMHICFLSDETRPVASIIGTILQCAFEFRSCLTSSSWDVELDQGGLLGELSRINVSQVLTIKQKFHKSLKELHLCYLKSPKHRGFGLPRFWGYLNYNAFYADVGNETVLNAFPV